MAHRRVKNIDYDDDDLSDDDYDNYEDTTGQAGGDEQEELTDYDREQLQLGTAKVRSSLDPSLEVTDKEIQDALWHYYYDIGKTITYLKNLKVPASTKQQPKAKQPSRFDQAANNAAVQTPTQPTPYSDVNNMDSVYQTLLGHEMTFQPRPPSPIGWGPIPPERRANISVIRTHSPPRLLGGSAKPSKLAALAAARKKKEEEKRSAAANDAPSDAIDKAVSILSKLSVNKENAPSRAPSVVDATQTAAAPARRAFPIRQKPQEKSTEPAPAEPVKSPIPESPESKPEPKPQIKAAVATPSGFAQAMFGVEPSSHGGVSLNGHDREGNLATKDERRASFTFPYLLNPVFVQRDPFAEPSPDDKVLNAQSKAKGLKQPAPKGNNTSTKTAQSAQSEITNGVSELSVQDLPKPKSKNLNVLEEFQKANMKNAASFVVVGHVDHGKSTLMGRLLYDLKVVDEKSLEKLRRESKKIGKSSFALAWVMDATSDERERGITVDIATNYFETDKTRFTILDAPGHQDFIPNMISGASQADFAVLVIDSSNNSFESGLRGQTKEHALLVRSMGVQKLIVAVNKMDMADWSEERFTEIRQQMTAFLTAANFAAKNITFIPCSGLLGENILRPVGQEKAPWYNGNTLVQELDSVEPTKRALEKPLRLTVSEVFRSSPNNPVSISGRIDAGSLQVGDVIKIMPSGESALIRTLEADSNPADWAVAGQIVTLNLADIEAQHLKPGDIVCHPQNAVSNVKRFTTKILTFEHVMPMYVDVHRGPLQTGGKIVELVAGLDKGSGKVVKKKPRVVQPGAVARVIVELESELPLEAPSKVILREGGRTVAAGLVES